MNRPLLRLLPLFRPQALLLGACVLGSVVATQLMLMGPYVVQQAIDRGIGQGDASTLKTLAATYFAVVVAQMSLQYASRIGIERAAQGAMLRLKTRLFDHLIGHDQAFHDQHSSGRLITRVQGDTQALQVLFTEVILALPSDLVLGVGMFAMLWWQSPKMAVVVFAVLPPYLLLFAIFRRFSPPLFLAEREVRAKLTGFLAEHLRAMPTLQRYDRADWARARADALNGEVQGREVAEGMATVLFFNSVFMVRSLGFAAVLWAGSVLVAYDEVTTGVLVMGLGYLRQMFNPLMRLSHNLSTIERARAAATRMGTLLDEAPKIVDPPQPVAWPGLSRGIRLEGVRFRYGDGPMVLDGVDLEVPAGARVGVVGATGSGKSTLINLLLRFRDPTEGRVTVDGVDLRSLAVADLREHVGLVLQDVHLFPGTVLDNLGGDRPRARAACDRLGLSTDLDREIGGGGHDLSRGERQLLTFARALVGDPPLLVLDEATSAVDPATEARVQAALAALQAGRTTVIVAHRLATVRDCDRIYVMAKGAVVEAGTHDELMRKRGMYAALYELQHGHVEAA